MKTHATPLVSERETRSTRAKYNRNARFYDLMEWPIEVIWYRKWRKELFARLQPGQRVLEIGVGTGENLPFYPPGVRVVGIDLSEGMFSRALAQASKRGVLLAQADAQRLPFRDQSFDVVVATFVFCSVPNPVLGFREAARVLKPNGRFLLLEHVLPQQPWLARLFDRFDPLLVKFTGVHINRKTAANLQRAGWKLMEDQNLLGTVYRRFVAEPETNQA